MRALRMLLAAVVIVAISACEAKVQSADSDSAENAPVGVGASPAAVDASVFAKRLNRQIEDFLPKGYRKAFSKVSIHGVGSLITYIYTYRSDYPLWRSVMTAGERKALQRQCDEVLLPGMKDVGISHPGASFLYLHPKATEVEMGKGATRDARFVFVTPASFGSKLRVADKFMCTVGVADQADSNDPDDPSQYDPADQEPTQSEIDRAKDDYDGSEGTECIDVTSYDYNYDNDIRCTRPDGSVFYTDYAGAAQYR